MRRIVNAGLLGAALACGTARAQDYDKPPGDVPEASDPRGEEGALAMRIDRLESALRRATGQIEELQNDNRKLADQLRRFREDTEFRLSGKAGAEPAPLASDSPATRPVETPTLPRLAEAPPKPSRRKDDAFDPDATPNAPGAPRQMGTSAPSAPLNLSSHAPEDPALKPLPTPTAPPERQAKGEEPTFVPSGVPFSDAKEQFRSAVTAFKAGQYVDAEALLKSYLAANAGAANAPDALFYLGETYMQRSRPREAAEQFLKVSTEFAKSSRAPESMVHLGLALAKLGNTEQACATFAEVGKRYPTASKEVKKSADRESQTLRCT